MASIDTDTCAAILTGATLEVFSTMLDLQAAAGPVSNGKKAEPGADGVVSFVGMAGEWAGTGSLSCSAQFACRLAARFLMTEFERVDEEVLDAFGELTNMVIGNVKTALEEKLGPMGLSIPTVIFGRNFVSRTPGTQDWIVIPFETAEGTLFVHMCLSQQTSRPRPRTAAMELIYE